MELQLAEAMVRAIGTEYLQTAARCGTRPYTRLTKAPRSSRKHTTSCGKR